MNKKLIKQLKGVGFVKAKTTLNLKVKGGFICDFFMRNRVLIIYNSEKVSKKYVSCTFEGILSLIKEHTGVDLTKKTKREEIEELKDCIAEMGEEKHRTWERLAALEGKTNSLLDVFKTTIEVPFKIMQDAVQSQNDAIEANKKEAHRANDRLTMVLCRLKVLGVWKDEECDNDPKYFLGMDFSLDAADALRYSVNQMIRKDVNKLIEQGDERILSKLKPIDTSKLKQAIKNMQGMFDKQASKMQAKEKKGFSVGDPVVIVCGKRLGFNGDLCRAIENKSIIKVANVNNKDKCVCVILNHREYYFKFDELEHVFKNKGINKGDFVVLSKGLLKEPITEEVIEAVNLQTVFEVLNIENGVYYLDKKLHKGESWTMEFDELEHAPAESPKEKALEFGGWAETLVDQNEIRKGTKVLLVNVRDEDSIGFTDGKNSTHYLTSEELKPL